MVVLVFVVTVLALIGSVVFLLRQKRPADNQCECCGKQVSEPYYTADAVRLCADCYFDIPAEPKS